MTAGARQLGALLGPGELGVVRAGVGRAVHVAAHRLDAGRNEDITLAGADGVGRHADGLQRGGAVAVHRHAGHVPEPGQDGRHPGDVVAGLAAGLAATEEHVLDLGGVQLGHLLEHGADARGRDRSSGRHSTSEPLLARPMGVRPVATMTASGMATAPR